MKNFGLQHCNFATGKTVNSCNSSKIIYTICVIVQMDILHMKFISVARHYNKVIAFIITLTKQKEKKSSNANIAITQAC